MKSLKVELKAWNKNVFGIIDDKIGGLEERITSLDDIANTRDLSDAELNERKESQMDLWTWFKRKEMYQVQNSRAKCFKEGDKNTKCFHAIASMRIRRNTISSLTIDNTYTNIFEPASIRKEATSYFKNLFN